MGFLSRFRSRVLGTTWQFAPGGVLWRVVPAGDGLIIGEARTEDRSNVRFFCLDQQGGDVLWRDRDFRLGWWCGIEGLDGPVLFLHGFASPDLPLHRGIYAVDVRSGELLWSSPGLRFSTAGSGRVYAEEDTRDGSVLVELDGVSGERLQRRGEGEPVVPSHAAVTADTGAGGLVFSGTLEAAETLHPGTGALIDRICPPDARTMPPDVVVDGDLIIAVCSSVMTREGQSSPTVRSAIMVISRSRQQVLYREVLSGPEGTHLPDAFFVRNGILVFIRERKILSGVDLRRAGKP
jgi:hypothetical protein